MHRTNEIFTAKLLNWFDKHGRKHLPWQNPRTAYRVWLSEIMLQQTQVKTVIPYFLRFIERFPDVQTLAQAAEDDVFSYWAGLGYYSRARNLHKTAQIIHHQFQNKFPDNLEQLKSLPGIGPSTAAAIASLAYNQPTAIMDGNVKRVLSRYFLIDGYSEQAAVKATLWQLAKTCMSTTRCADYTQAIMDMGATCCTVKRPACETCPLQETCLAHLQDKVAQYPHKRIKPKIPKRYQQFLLFYTAENAIYLEKRPPTGIWGGLWSLPSIEMDDNLDQFTNKKGMQVIKTEQFMSLKHTFSHFHLYMSVISSQTLLYSKLRVSESTGRWFKPDELNQVGLPKPMQMIMKRFLDKTTV